MSKTVFKGDKRDRQIAWSIYVNMAEMSEYFDNDLYKTLYRGYRGQEDYLADATEDQLKTLEQQKWMSFGMNLRNLLLRILEKNGHPTDNNPKGMRKPMRIDVSIIDILNQEVVPFIKRVATMKEEIAEGVVKSIEDQAAYIHSLLTNICHKAAYEGEFMIVNQPAPSATEPGKSTGSSDIPEPGESSTTEV